MESMIFLYTGNDFMLFTHSGLRGEIIFDFRILNFLLSKIPSVHTKDVYTVEIWITNSQYPLMKSDRRFEPLS